MFKVKGTVVGFDEDEQLHPCHFRYQIGDTVIWDGEKFIGRICPSIIVPFAEKIKILYNTGGRHKEGEMPAAYIPFWHSPFSVYDPSYKKYDGVGFRPTLERPEQNYKYITDETLFDKLPPGVDKLLGGPGTGVRKKEILICGDSHTRMRMELEAIDLVDYGDGLPYTRRMIVILDKVKKNPGVARDQILSLFDDDERDNIYPSLGQNMLWALTGELEVLDYLNFSDEKATITEKGLKKLEDYKKGLTDEEIDALKL